MVGFNLINILFGEYSLNVDNRPVNLIIFIYKAIHIYVSEAELDPNYVDLLH